VIVPRVLRRLGLPVLLGVEAALLALLVVVAVVGLVTVVVDRRARLLRLAVMAGAYLVLGWAALGMLFGLWLARPFLERPRWDRANVALVAWALGGILGVAGRIVGFAVSLPSTDGSAPAPFEGDDPVLVLARHGGIGDSFTVVWLLADRFGRRPRVVLRSLLLWDPLLDVALTRLGACFLPRRARRGDTLDARVASLASSLVPGDALLLFPEGGNWTPRRRLTTMGRLWAARRMEAVRAAALMDHVLAPRPGGVLACLHVHPELPVVVVAHTGLDRLTSAGAVWAALPFSTPMAIRWWPAAPPPLDDDARVAWLVAEWAVVDQWIDRTSSGTGR
jgi:1-acyl-sn-glycerol-3-phosphate acyltransferase